MIAVFFTSILAAEHVEGEQHGVGEGGGLLLTGEVESVHLPRVTPLVEGGRGLVVLQALHYGIVDDHLSQRSEVKLVRTLKIHSLSISHDIVCKRTCWSCSLTPTTRKVLLVVLW